MYIEKLTSQIINDVLSGLGGYHSNLSINRDQVADEIVALRLSLLKDHRIIISSSALGRLNSDGTYSYDKRNEKINVYCIAANTN